MSSLYEQRVLDALADLSNQTYTSIRAAAKAHDVHRSTLTRRMQGIPSKKIARQEQQLLSGQQEELLVNWIIDLDRTGHAPTHANIREMVALISRLSGGPDRVGEN